MATRTLTAPLDGAITLGITATELELTVEGVPGLTTAQLELTGPDGTVDGTTEHTTAAAWYVDVPAPEPTVISTGGGLVIQGGTITGGIHTRSGRTVINGMVISTGSDTNTASEPVTARVRIPAQSALRTRIEGGAVRTAGHLADVDHRGHNTTLYVASAGDVTADTHNGAIDIDQARGAIDIETHNGPITVRATGTRTIARTHNGAIDIGAASNGPITARTHNSPITVRTNGYDPDVRTHTHNGAKRIR